MNYMFNGGHISPNADVPDAVMFGEDEIPSYEFHPPKKFDEFGLVELMEGIFEYPNKTIEQVRTFLNSIGYKERIK